MSSFYCKTPLMRRVFASQNVRCAASPEIMVKYEFFQPSGSFKSRGIGNLIYKEMQRIRQKGSQQPHVFASSGGNAGLAAATASQQLGLPCTVVVPETTRRRMVERIRSTGAEVISRGRVLQESDDYLRSELMKNVDVEKVAPIYAHPFDNPLIWEGHATMVDEMVESLHLQDVPLERVKGIVCSVGGGGLYNGIVHGLEKHGLAESIPVVAVETDGCEVLHRSLQLGRNVSMNPKSVATSLCTSFVTELTLRYAQKYRTKSVVLEQLDVVETCLKFAEESNIVTEPACGAALHLGYHPEILERELGALTSQDVVIVIACGGSTMNLSDLKECKEDLQPKMEEVQTPFTTHQQPIILIS
ncbi:AaceriAFR747Wp [[Ashbya] aceris (nom. inval.)]|nr:AaceriAFR747Wp [[Ashbya] aceris (nom. inval.)]